MAPLQVLPATLQRAGKHVRPVVVGCLVAVLSLGIVAPSSARVSPRDLSNAQTRLHSLYHRLDLLVEQYDQARVNLHRTEGQLSQARQALAQDEAQAQTAQQELDARAQAAYESSGSVIAAFLGTSSFSDLSAEAEDIATLAQQDESLAIQARVAAERARRAATRLRSLVAQRSALVQTLAIRKQQIQSDIASARTLVRRIRSRLAEQAAARRAAARRRARQAAAAAAHAPPSPPPPSRGGGSGLGGGPGRPPPPAHGAAAAIAAARSVLGVPYVFGGASPSGFDCSGLTMWAWAHAGLSLPHSAAMQYAVLPHVAEADLEPGDLVFFYQPIDHVGLYIGGGMMIDANHTGGSVGVRPVYWSAFAGAGRP